MEQNRLKELILSMRKSKHNMFKKVADFALAVEDKGVIDMDTHELSNLVKDTLTKRRAKTFYADVFSSVIGEPDGVGEAPVFMAINMLDDTNYAFTQWKFGDAVNYTFDHERPLSMEPYVIFLTQEQYSKFSVSTDTSIDVMEEVVATPIEEFFESPEEMSDSLNLHVDASFYEQYPYASFFPYIVAMGKSGFESNSEEWQEHYDESMRMYTLSFIYDGVKYTYKPDGTIEISKVSNTTPVAKEAPTFRSISNQSGNYSVSTYTLGDPITVPEDINDHTGLIDPYMILLTDEEAQKFNVSCETNIPDFAAAEEGAFKLFDIPSDSGLSQFKGNCTKGFNVFYLSILSQAAAEYQSEIPDAYIKVTITYDGVDYVYLS